MTDRGLVVPRPALLTSRRAFLIGGGAALLAGCSTTRFPDQVAYTPQGAQIDPMYLEMYGPMPDEKFPMPATDISRIDPQFLRQVVYVPEHIPNRPGTIVVDPGARHLYLIQDGGQAIRYGVGVGREGFGWNGNAVIKRKQEWPTWTPPKEMVARDPDAAPWANGMPGGLDNPLGARALYLFQGNRDTLYRLHGTREPWTIGTAVSSGCVRLINQDIIDLYGRVPTGTEVTVLDTAGPMA